MVATRLAAVVALLGVAGCSYSYRNPVEALGPGEVGGRTVAGVELLIDGVAVSVQGAALDATSRANGRFTMLPLPVGHHSLMFRKGKERALQRDVEIAYGSDGQPQGLWLGDVTVPAAVTLVGSAAPDDGASLADNGLAIDEVSGATVPIRGGSSCGFTFEGLSIGLHRIRIFTRDPDGHAYVGGPAEVNILAAEAGSEKTLTRFPLHRAGPAAETGLVKLKFGVSGSIPGLKLSDLTIDGLPAPASFGSDGVAQVDLPEGLFTVEVKLPAGLPAGVTPPPRKTFVAIKGRTLDLGTLYAVTDSAQNQAALSCTSDADCAPGTCTASHVCQGYTPPPQAPASVPYCDQDSRACTVGPYGGVYTGQPPSSYSPPYTATCLGYGSGGASIAVACGTRCTPDGLTVLEATADRPGCQPFGPLTVTPAHAYSGDSSCSGLIAQTFTASGGTPPYVWQTAYGFHVSPDTTQATWDSCDWSVGDHVLNVTDSSSPAQQFPIILTFKRAPYVVSTSPSQGDAAVPVTATIFADFSEPLSPASVSAASFTVTTDASQVPVTGTVALGTAGTRLTFTPDAPLPQGATVSVTIQTTVTDLFGVAMNSVEAWSFMTWAPSTTKALTTFSLTDGTITAVAGTIDEAAKTVSVTLPAGTPVTALVATFTSTGVGVAVGTTAQVSGTTANDFTSPVTYVVTAEDGTTASYLVTATVPPSIGSFTPTGSLTGARYLHTATLLAGGNVLVVGGDSGSTSLTSAELYDPVAKTFGPAASLSVDRENHRAVRLLDGRVLVTGGWSRAAATSGGLNSAERYDPATSSWSLAGTMVVARHSHTATLLSDGRVLVAGGYDQTGSVALASAEIYEPTTDAWTPAASMTHARLGLTATRLLDGKVLVTGDQGSSSRTAEIYDPATDTWSATANLMLGARSYHTATLLNDGKVLVVGGSLAQAELFDPVGASFAGAGSSSSAAKYHAATLLPDGTVLITGGLSGSTTMKSSERYSLATFAWKTQGPMTVARYSQTATLLLDGSVLVVGGWDGASTNATAELYR
jgi:hypothetical protein